VIGKVKVKDSDNELEEILTEVSIVKLLLRVSVNLFVMNLNSFSFS
jgi:hypothetical protein